MPTSPRTPRHSPHPSLDFQGGSSTASYSPVERRHSNISLQEPSTPLRGNFSSDGMDGMFSSGGMGGGMGGGNGLGNLADELADMLSDGEEEDDYYGNDDGEEGGAPPDICFEGEDDGGEGKNHRLPQDSAVEAESPSSGLAPGKPRNASLSLPSPNGKGHRRAGSEYDGSEYGSESDLDSPGMPPRLVEKMDEVEALTRRGTEHNGSAADGTFKRVTEGLRDLGSQSGVEGGATRLITAHSALTSHLTHQTRQIQTLSFPILSPLVAPPEPEVIDELLPMLINLSDLMPRPSTTAFNSLASLHSITSDLVQTLNYLSDTLHMSRQTTTTAMRRLKSAKELVAEMREDEELREEGERWIDKGNWGERLERRECAHVCGEVVGGFEEVCNSWRARLVAQVEAQM
ncbi:hypothetical protein V8F33_006782 [Rhypophila sp. PSN 637]